MIEERIKGLREQLNVYLDQFKKINLEFDQGIFCVEKAEALIDDYASFILDPSHLESDMDFEKVLSKALIEDIQESSAHCVWRMEKYRAMACIQEKDVPVAYFQNIEACIDMEFQKLGVDKESKVLLIGIGAFPMTPLLLYKKTGAQILGIDIDDEAATYAKSVLEVFGMRHAIEVSTQPYDTLEFTKKATHIILASTIPEKMDILKNLYPLSREDVKVSMRYGNGIKMLFNYPLVESEIGKWKKTESLSLLNHVFDVAFFQK